MGRHTSRRGAALACSIAFAFALQITEASAFSTEPVAPPSANLQANQSPMFGAQPVPSQMPQFDLNDPLAAGKSKGTDLTIPGLGTIGTIPKVDFGLELLYGPKNGPEAYQLDQHAPDSDMQIKGTFTHKF